MAFTLEEYDKYYSELQEGYMIQEIEPKDGERQFEVVKIPEPTIEEKSARKREERDYLLNTVVDPVVTNPLRWEDLSDAEKSKYRAYRLYLLDIPQQEEFPDIEIKSFEEFLQ